MSPLTKKITFRGWALSSHLAKDQSPCSTVSETRREEHVGVRWARRPSAGNRHSLAFKADPLYRVGKGHGARTEVSQMETP